MSEVTKGVDDTLETNDDVVSQERESKVVDNNTDQSVKFETYDKVMRRLKAREAELDKVREERTMFEQEKLQAEGNKDQLIESLRKEVNEHKTKYRSAVGSIALSQGKNALVDEAVKAGCNSPEILTKLLEQDLQSLEYDSDFRPDRAQVKALIEDARQKNPILFSKSAPNIANHNIKSGDQKAPAKKPIHLMTDEELDKVWAQAKQQRN